MDTVVLYLEWTGKQKCMQGEIDCLWHPPIGSCLVLWLTQFQGCLTSILS